MNLYGLRKYRCDLDKAEEVTVRQYVDDARFDNLHMVTSSTVQGYVKHGKRVIVPYDGKYGTGYVVCTPTRNPYTGKTSSKYMNIYYWVKKDEVEAWTN